MVPSASSDALYTGRGSLKCCHYYDLTETMRGIRDKLEQMARTPRQQLRRLLSGTLAALVFALALLVSSEWEQSWLFYLLASGLIAACLYALPGYLGIWLWRLRRILFDIED